MDDARQPKGAGTDMRGNDTLRSRRLLLAIGPAVVALVVLFSLPNRWCARHARAWYGDDKELQLSLARGVEQLVLVDPIAPTSFSTGSERFDGEWLFGSYLMAGIGYCQLAAIHPDQTDWCRTRSAACIRRLQLPAIRAFDAQSWNGEDPLASLSGDNGHAAYLGYLNLLLGMHRKAFGEEETVTALNNRITAALIRRMANSPTGLIQTYPGETYPVDNCFVAGSIGLHQSLTGQPTSAALKTWLTNIREHVIDPDTGLLIQAVEQRDFTPLDEPRGSGTVLGLLAVRYADPELARELYKAMQWQLMGNWLGFGAVGEYPAESKGGGDIDSGPIVFGYGMSATGFSLGAARACSDWRYFRRLYATTHLCGAPLREGNTLQFVSGGALGNSILFAMLTTPPLETDRPSEELPQ
jgi:hypothetical protein